MKNNELKATNERIWTTFRGLYGWAVFNNKYKYISHYEETRLEALKTVKQWNAEKREF